MTVRLTPTESDSPPPPQVPASPTPGDVRVPNRAVDDPLSTLTASAAPDRPTDGDTTAPEAPPPAGGPGSDPSGAHESPAAVEGRRSLREARRQRRRAMWLCAAVVALCLALTIVVVMLARYRPVSTSSASATSVAHPSVAAPVVDHVLVATSPSRGAPAPEGGTP